MSRATHRLPRGSQSSAGAHSCTRSIIIVGVGNNDFDRMNILDCDAAAAAGGGGGGGGGGGDGAAVTNMITMIEIITAVALLHLLWRLHR